MENPVHPACLDVEQLEKHCVFKKTRTGGPGGQHRNKVETAIVVTHIPTGTIGQAGERRSQRDNRTVAIQRLRINLAIGIRSPNPRNNPSELWRSRCHSKISVSRDHSDFACLLAESLDWIFGEKFQISAAAKKLGCSTSQLIKFLKIENAAFSLVNSKRKELNLPVLK